MPQCLLLPKPRTEKDCRHSTADRGEVVQYERCALHDGLRSSECMGPKTSLVIAFGWCQPYIGRAIARGQSLEFLAMPTAAYLELLDRTARQILSGKRAATPDTPPLLERLPIKPAMWFELVTHIRTSMTRCAREFLYSRRRHSIHQTKLTVPWI